MPGYFSKCTCDHQEVHLVYLCSAQQVVCVPTDFDRWPQLMFVPGFPLNLPVCFTMSISGYVSLFSLLLVWRKEKQGHSLHLLMDWKMKPSTYCSAPPPFLLSFLPSFLHPGISQWRLLRTSNASELGVFFWSSYEAVGMKAECILKLLFVFLFWSAAKLGI